MPHLRQPSDAKGLRPAVPRGRSVERVVGRSAMSYLDRKLHSRRRWIPDDRSTAPAREWVGKNRPIGKPRSDKFQQLATKPSTIRSCKLFDTTQEAEAHYFWFRSWYDSPYGSECSRC